MPEPTIHPPCPGDTDTSTPAAPPPGTPVHSGDAPVCTADDATAVTCNGADPAQPVVTALQRYAKTTPKPTPPRGATARRSSLALRQAIVEWSLLLANRFRVMRTLDIAAACFPERPFKAALTAAQRAVRGMVKAGLLRRYKTDRFQTVYGLTQRGVDWLGERGYNAASSVRRVSDMTNPEHRLWAQFLVICAWSRGLEAFTEAELMQRLAAHAMKSKTPPPPGYIKVRIPRHGADTSKWLRPDLVAYEARGNGVAWFEVDRSKRGASRQADLRALIGALGRKTADGRTLRFVVVHCKTERIERDARRVVEQLAEVCNAQVLTEGRRHIRATEGEPGVYGVYTAVPFKRDDGRTVLLDEQVGRIVIQMLPVWLPKVRIDASNRWSTDGWFESNFLPFKRPTTMGRWEMPVSPLWTQDEEMPTD